MNNRDLSFADITREQVISFSPFTVRRAARWSECDPAGVVYTGNFSEYLMSATHLFRRHILGGDWHSIRETAQVDLPAKALSLVFKGSLWPDDVFDTSIFVGDIRERTFDFLVHAKRMDGAGDVFDGRLSVICVSASDRRIALPIPAALRTLLEQSRTRCPAPPELLSQQRS